MFKREKLIEKLYFFVPFMSTHHPNHLIKTSVKINGLYEERELVHYTCQTFKWVGRWIDIKGRRKYNFSANKIELIM